MACNTCGSPCNPQCAAAANACYAARRLQLLFACQHMPRRQHMHRCSHPHACTTISPVAVSNLVSGHERQSASGSGSSPSVEPGSAATRSKTRSSPRSPRVTRTLLSANDTRKLAARSAGGSSRCSAGGESDTGWPKMRAGCLHAWRTIGRGGGGGTAVVYSKCTQWWGTASPHSGQAAVHIRCCQLVAVAQVLNHDGPHTDTSYLHGSRPAPYIKPAMHLLA